MANINRRAAFAQFAYWFSEKNRNAPPGKHFDLQVNDYVDDNCDDGYHWDMDAYRCIPDE